MLGVPVVHSDDQNVRRLVLDDNHFLAFLMQLSVKSICTSYWATNSFAKELICYLVISCFGYILGLIQAFDISVPVVYLILLFRFHNMLKLLQ